MSSEADIKDCPGVSVGHANLFLFFLPIWFSLRKRVFLERCGPVWRRGGGGRPGRRGGREAGKEAKKRKRLLSFQTRLLFMPPLKCALSDRVAFGE